MCSIKVGKRKVFVKNNGRFGFFLGIKLEKILRRVYQLKLLVSDDEPFSHNNIKLLLRNINFNFERIFHTFDGEEALAICMKEKPDIILTDIRMPKMDGIQLVREIKERLPTTATVFMSGYSDKEYLLAAIRLQTVRYIEKPFFEEDLLEALQEAEVQHKKLLRLFDSGEENIVNSSLQNDFFLQDDYIEKTLNYIRDNYTDAELNLEQIAAHVHLTPSYLSTIFKEKTGKTILHTITQHRMERAFELIRKNCGVFDVARLVGYKDGHYFSRLFKKYTGVSPSEYSGGRFG